MLYETQRQLFVFVFLAISGIICGILFVFSSFFKKNLTKNITLSLLIFLSFFVFAIVNLKTNYGEIRIYTILTFVLSIIFTQIILKKFVAHLHKKCYNKNDGTRDQKREK